MDLDTIPPYLQEFLTNLRHVIFAPIYSDNRVFVVYLLTSALFALFVYRRLRKSRPEEATSFLGFLFPKRVWSHPSAWLDLRYYFFHGITGHFIATSGGIFVTLGVYILVTGLDSMPNEQTAQVLTGWKGVAASVIFMILAVIVADFTAFYAHYLQHKVPLLWQFHKVHHSAEVMHPLSNFREHPVDNLFYSLVIGATYGGVLGIVTLWFGYIPSGYSLFGVPVFMFLFNVTGYNLRHSHVWLRWPGRWSIIFPSPAHHQVHHSSHPDHLDKNFAFMFPIWDVIFGCYIMPEDNRDVRFGVTEKDRGEELNSCLRLYALPFRDAWRLMRRKTRVESGDAADGALTPVAAAAAAPDVTPHGA